MNRSKINNPAAWDRWRRSGAIKVQHYSHCYVIAAIRDDGTLAFVDGFSERAEGLSVCPAGLTYVPIYDVAAANFSAARKKALRKAPSWVYPWLADGRKWHDERWRLRMLDDLPAPREIVAEANRRRAQYRALRGEGR